MKGVIKNVSDKGFAFIGAEGLQRDVFLHASQLDNSYPFANLQKGDVVEFEIFENNKGLNASNCKVL